jgi:hypothetical protein
VVEQDGRYHRASFRQVRPRDVTDDVGIDALIFVPQLVADRHDIAPSDVGLLCPFVVQDVAHGSGVYLDGALHRQAQNTGQPGRTHNTALSSIALLSAG